MPTQIRIKTTFGHKQISDDLKTHGFIFFFDLEKGSDISNATFILNN